VAEVGDRRNVVPVARAERHRCATDECRPLVDRIREALERNPSVRVGRDVNDLRPAQLLRVGDLPDRGELVLADDDAVALPGQVERGHECAHRLRDGGRDRDVVGLGVHERGEGGASGLVPLHPEIPFRSVLVPAGEPLLRGRPNAVRERAL
jgi:hypothetical protein